MTALEQLAAEIAQARALGFVPARWDELAQTALAEQRREWRTETVFRLEAQVSARWCQRHFAQYQAHGLARLGEKGKREWHLHARIPRRGGQSPSKIKDAIVQAFDEERRAS